MEVNSFTFFRNNIEQIAAKVLKNVFIIFVEYFRNVNMWGQPMWLKLSLKKSVEAWCKSRGLVEIQSINITFLLCFWKGSTPVQKQILHHVLESGRNNKLRILDRYRENNVPMILFSSRLHTLY